MERSKIDILKERFAFDEWRGSNTLSENLFVWKFSPGANEMSGWLPKRVQVIVPPADGVADGEDKSRESAAPAQSAVQSIWQAGGDEETLLRLDSFECASRAEAHEYLIRVLGQFQSPLIKRADDVGGDVAFSMPGGTAVVFARANMVFALRNAGRKVENVAGIANDLDKKLTGKPEAEKREIDLSGKTRESGEAAPLAAELPLAAADGGQWYKFFTSSGEMRLENGSPVYVPGETGSDKIEMFTVQGNRAGNG